MRLPVPLQLKEEFAPSERALNFIRQSRLLAEQVLVRKTPRVAAIFGPCSVHDPEALFDFANKFEHLRPRIEQTLFPVLRFFIEKPRTRLGWKGLLYDPHLDGSNNIAEGLRQARKLLLELAERGIPCATELLDPLAVPYFDDLIVWGMIGARTSASQPHRQMASGLPFPVGFKNDLLGETGPAITGILAARAPHSHIGINAEGQIAAVKTSGNPLTHLVLRGAETNPNYDASSVHSAIEALRSQGIQPQLLIDCSHGNSGKDPQKQEIALKATLDQITAGNQAIAGFMLESHLFSGKQTLSKKLLYGVSITDPCLGWEETERLLIEANEKLSVITR